MSDLPPGLRGFGDRLEKAVERDVAERRHERRDRRWTRNIGLPTCAALVAAAVSAGAARVVDRDGDPIAPEASGRGAALGAAKDPAIVMATATANPGGGPPWVLRVYTNPAGRECIQIGRLHDGVFGQVLRERFRARPAGATGTCLHADARGPLVAVLRVPAQSLTLVFGLAVDRRPVTVRFAGSERRVRPAGLGAFVVLFDEVDPREPVIVRSRVEGRTTERRLR